MPAGSVRLPLDDLDNQKVEKLTKTLNSLMPLTNKVAAKKSTEKTRKRKR
jgi:hypothetical protein